MKALLLNAAANIVRGWRTTLLGLALFVATIASVFKVEAVTWTDAILPILLSTGLMLMPKQTKGALRDLITRKAPLILALLLLAGCTGSKENSASSQLDTLKIKSTGTVKTIITNTVKADSAGLQVELSKMQPNQVYTQKSDRAEVETFLDEKGNLSSKCKCKEETLKDSVEQEIESSYEVPVHLNHSYQPEQEKESPAMWIWRNFIWPFALVIGALIVFVLSALFLKHLTLSLFNKPAPKEPSL
ncbi:hypothetical protein [uncultured Pontibacter sp.]|uniref:hypothetical protein n=1 Tax=uncultured Pontibacter sp. TaxID=453356 RepID=UPI002622C84C|nr:hypothetical protein [uncultured Pontibacter sp.]